MVKWIMRMEMWNKYCNEYGMQFVNICLFAKCVWPSELLCLVRNCFLFHVQCSLPYSFRYRDWAGTAPGRAGVLSLTGIVGCYGFRVHYRPKSPMFCWRKCNVYFWVRLRTLCFDKISRFGFWCSNLLFSAENSE